MGRKLTYPIVCYACNTQSHDVDFLAEHQCRRDVKRSERLRIRDLLRQQS